MNFQSKNFENKNPAPNFANQKITKNMMRKLQQNWYGARILILGFGKEGIDSYLALRKMFPHKILAVADKKELKDFDKKTQTILAKDKNLKKYFGQNYLTKIGNYDLILRTPGIAEKIFQPFLKKGSVVSSQTEIFFDNFPGLIIGVTGTKGKGTTASLICAILKKAGLKVFLGGNIGSPVFQYLLKSKPNDVFIYELSSHQLQNLKKSPQIAVFLNIFLDHQDYYKDFNDYKTAKANIAIHQTTNDVFVYNSSDPLVKKIAKQSKAKKIDFSLTTPLNNFEKSLKKYYKLVGDFNFLNLRAALKVAGLFGVSEKIILEAVRGFVGLPHRLEFAGKYRGIEFYDNSMATIPETTILDLKTFNGKPISLIVGGSEKGSDYANLAKEILKTSVKNLIIFSGTGPIIWQKLQQLSPNFPLTAWADTMKDAVRLCYERTPKNGICLLSPASASFNMFKNYQDRGEQFKKWVKFYGQQKTF